MDTIAKELDAGKARAQLKKLVTGMMQQAARTHRIGRVGLFSFGGVAASSR